MTTFAAVTAVAGLVVSVSACTWSPERVEAVRAEAVLVARGACQVATVAGPVVVLVMSLAVPAAAPGLCLASTTATALCARLHGRAVVVPVVPPGAVPPVTVLLPPDDPSVCAVPEMSGL